MKLVKEKPQPLPSTSLPDSLHLDKDYFGNVENRTFRIVGDRYADLGILHNDLLIIGIHDRPRGGDIIFEIIDGDPHLERFAPYKFYLAAIDGKLLPKRRTKNRIKSSVAGTVRFVIRQMKEV